MKKQIISLAVGASFFATCSAFAMEDKEINKSKLPIKWEITEKQQLEGEGNFQRLKNPGNKKVVLGIMIESFSLKDILGLSLCSKGMYNLLNTDYNWKLIAKNKGIEVPQGTLLIKEFVEQSLLFLDPKLTYKVMIPRLLSFMKTSEEKEGYSPKKKYLFSLGQRPLQMEISHPGRYGGPHHLETLDKDAFVYFKQEKYAGKVFRATIGISKNSPGHKNLSSEEYKTLIYQDFSSGAGDYLCENMCVIENLKEEKK